MIIYILQSRKFITIVVVNIILEWLGINIVDFHSLIEWLGINIVKIYLFCLKKRRGLFRHYQNFILADLDSTKLRQNTQ